MDLLKVTLVKEKFIDLPRICKGTEFSWEWNILGFDWNGDNRIGFIRLESMLLFNKYSCETLGYKRIYYIVG